MTTMNERPTPETDALAGEWIACECVPVSHSRKLERERDEAEQQLKTMRGVMARLRRSVSRRMMPDDPTPEDRMELREAFDAASSILHNVPALAQSGGEKTSTKESNS